METAALDEGDFDWMIQPLWMRPVRTGRAHVFKMGNVWYALWRSEDGPEAATVFTHKAALLKALAVTR